MGIEETGGVHSKERSQVDRSKTKADQFAEHTKQNGSNYVATEKTIEIKDKVRVLE